MNLVHSFKQNLITIKIYQDTDELEPLDDHDMHTAWAAGEVYGFTINVISTTVCSLWGIYGYQNTVNMANEAVNSLNVKVIQNIRNKQKEIELLQDKLQKYISDTCDV